LPSSPSWVLLHCRPKGGEIEEAIGEMTEIDGKIAIAEIVMTGEDSRTSTAVEIEEETEDMW